jgi:hypothetical protein
VGDDEHRAAPRQQVAPPASRRFYVEMVGRLVEQQQLGAVEQQSCDRDPPALATRRTAIEVSISSEIGAAARRREARRGMRCSPTTRVCAPAHERGTDVSVLVELVSLVEQGEVEIAGAG